MIRAFDEQFGITVLHAWGMTEMSPLGTVNTYKHKHLALPAEERDRIRLKQGRSIFGVGLKIVDGDGNPCPTTARPSATCWCAAPGSPAATSGARAAIPARRLVPHRRRRHHRPRRLHADHRPLQGRHQVRRRMDLLDRPGEHRRRPSGGGRSRRDRRVPIRKWDERPLLVVVKKPDRTSDRDELIAF
jgi:hypothetical protein